MSTALLENSIVAGRNKIRTSPLDHRTVSISRLWFAYCANQYSTMFGVDLGKTDLKSEQNDTSGRGARARNIYSSARQFQRLESKQNRTYNIIIHFNRRSVSISPLTCLFYRREVSFTIHHKFLLVYITLFQLSALYSVVYPVCKSKANFAHRFSPPCIDSHGSDDALRRNVNRNVRTVFCVIEIAEVVSSLAELE